MMKALWFSRHAPSAAQLAEISAMGFEVAGLEAGIALGAQNLGDEGDLNRTVWALMCLADEHGAAAVFGVFAAPVQERLYRALMNEGVPLPCYAAWNIARTAEGGKATFEHLRWCLVGHLQPLAT